MAEKDYNLLVGNINSLLARARQKTYNIVNQLLVRTYWHVGKHIVEFEQQGKQKAEYGSNLLFKLSKDLSKEQGKGFSERNLEQMRKLFLLFPIPQTLSAKSFFLKLSWSHYCELMKVKETLARSFYERQSLQENWSLSELKRQINSLLFERIALSKDKNQILELSKQGQIIEQPQDVIKEPYILEFLGLDESKNYSEMELEQALISKLKNFILELGKDFLFVERQKRITIANRHYYIDLVFYHRTLHCFVLVDLKLGELTHADTGQMNFYLNYYKENELRESENEPIGLILCASKDYEFARYILNDKNMFASEYKLKLPSEKILKEQIRKLLA